ncbi:uncharacterized protein EI97DRAFT_437767 [Westerdykella ornata]|uniref:Uncharacterized protein n=1 Tax=Westerdykella ornata TaxID=318751 RepID=A0A6A6J8I3_WESOR|nr:uncharacterized protein EI97DRAFT_437767 [Westerdykella ornata]KAF2271519.1 hypothetical protein EI97DRAFT_437767 [Westerdykella ornata]
MSGYGEDDDFYDYDAWMYIEDEYLPADDLAEHAVHSPPPTFDLEEDEDVDNTHFDYFLDLDYGSDGYDDAEFYTHDPKSQDSKTGHKRKRGPDLGSRRRKKQKLGEGLAVSSPEIPRVVNQPVVWRQQEDRGTRAKLLEGETESYAIMKDWRERLAATPEWKPVVSSRAASLKPDESEKAKAEQVADELMPDLRDTEELDDADEGMTSGALMAALQRNLAAAGGPLTGMDPQQLLQFAMRMMNDEAAGDDIAGELADDLLGRLPEEGDDDEEPPADIMEWLSKNRPPHREISPETDIASANPSLKSPPVERRPPTPPVCEANTAHAKDKLKHQGGARVSTPVVLEQNRSSLSSNQPKRKAKDGVDSINETSPRKRATRSYDAPTAASQARASNRSSGDRPSRKPS